MNIQLFVIFLDQVQTTDVFKITLERINLTPKMAYDLFSL